jgi:hypothetical protein
MKRRKSASADSPTEASAAAVLEPGEETPEADETPTFPDHKGDPGLAGEDVAPAEEVVYQAKPEEKVLGAEEPKPKVDDATRAANLGTALKHEREHGKRLRDELAQERAAHEHAEAEAKRLRDEATRAENRKTLEEAQDLTSALPAIKSEIISEMEPGIISARKGVIRISQKLARFEHDDYDEMLNKSGVADAIAIDPATGKPRDPVMWRKLILMSEDPGEDAYALAVSIREERGELEPTTPRSDGAREETPRPVIEVRTTADRFGGVRRLSHATGREPRVLTDTDIEKMPDEEYARLPKSVRDAYLAGGRV